MKSGFVQLLVKNAIAGRTSKPIQVQRYKPSDSFKKYMTEILPKMEQSIQINILKKTLIKIKSARVRTQLINSYLHRLFRLRIYEREDAQNYKYDNIEGGKQQKIMIDPTIIKDIRQHSSYDLAAYALFNQQDMETVFKHGCFGDYHKNQYKHTQKFGILIRQECLSISQGMKKISQQRQINWNQIYQIEEDQIQDYVNNQNNYPSLFAGVSNKIYKKSQEYRGKEDWIRVWGTSTVCDVLTNSILQNLKNVKDIDDYVNQAVEYVMNLEVKLSANDIVERFKKMPLNPELPIKAQMPYNAQFFWRTPSMKNVFLGGDEGTGKSMILAYVSMLAYKSNWIVINVPSGFNWTHDRNLQEVQRAYNGLFLIYQHAVQWLDQFATANEHILKKMPVNKELYGKCDISGMRQDDYEPVPNRWDQARQTYTNQITQAIQGKLQPADIQREKTKRITDVLEQPKNLFELARVCAGGKDHQYSICAMGQLLNQIYDSDHPILECVDGFSHFYKPSIYPSFRYFNDRGLYGRVPPYHIAHIRLFMHLDGHKLKKGLKVVASSNQSYFKHQFDIKKLMLPQNYEHKVRNLNPKQFDSFCRFNILSKWWLADTVHRNNFGYMYTLSQGNIGDFQNIIKIGHYY